jgi:hypothetical protein
MTEPLPRAAHAEHLTDAFHRTGVLKDGRVRDVMVESSRPQFVSNIIRLRLTYDGAANGPSSVILKTGLPHAGGLPAGGHHEVAFYTQVASAMSGRFVPRCFEAFSDPDTNTVASPTRRPHRFAFHCGPVAVAANTGTVR